MDELIVEPTTVSTITAMIGHAQRFFFRNTRVDVSERLTEARTREVCTLSADEERAAEDFRGKGNFI